MYDVMFKDQTSNDMGLITTDIGCRQRAKEQIITYPVPYRDGILTEHIGKYEVYEREMEFYVPGAVERRAANAWLVGFGKLRTADDPGGFFKASVISDLDYSRFIKESKKLAVTFQISPPFFYLDSGDTPITLTAPGSINNPGTHTSEPLIRIVGDGNITLTINGRTLTLTNIETFIDIDPELTIPYFKNNENVGEKVVGEDPYFDVGLNEITWTGAVTEINILGRWREL